jgi:hypothetical protein
MPDPHSTSLYETYVRVVVVVFNDDDDNDDHIY